MKFCLVVLACLLGLSHSQEDTTTFPPTDFTTTTDDMMTETTTTTSTTTVTPGERVREALKLLKQVVFVLDILTFDIVT